MAHKKGHPGSKTGEGGPPGGGGAGASGTEFLGGFPGDYEVVIRDEGRPGDRRESTLAELQEANLGGYTQADVWAPQNEEPGAVAQLQVMLVEAGLLNEDDLVSPGHFDDNSMKAYKSLLVRANAMGTTWDKALRRMRNNPAARLASKGKGKGSEAGLLEVSNPDDLRSVFKASARRLLGKGELGDDVLDRMVQAYQAKETGYQKVESGVRVRPPGAEEFAEQELKRADPVGVDSHKALDAFDGIAALMRGASISGE